MPRGRGTHKTGLKDLTGRTFGKWRVIERGETRSTRIHWLCRCECGATKQVSGAHLSSGASTNCGCSRPKGTESRQFKHGKSETPEHSIWMRMIDRCENANTPFWHIYGGRGIKVCKRWREDFTAFLSDMGERPSPDHSIDRYPDKDGDYQPGNCRWATAKEQARNFRKNLIVELDGESMSLSEACEKSGINYGAAKWRYHAGHDWRGI